VPPCPVEFTEEPPVSLLDLSLLVATVVGVIVGLWAICWARGSRDPERMVWGRRLCVGTLVCLGLCAVVAAACQADALAPLGLSAGLLVVGMVGELPRVRGDQPAPPEPR
jgi:hypothetical protein